MSFVLFYFVSLAKLETRNSNSQFAFNAKLKSSENWIAKVAKFRAFRFFCCWDSQLLFFCALASYATANLISQLIISSFGKPRKGAQRDKKRRRKFALLFGATCFGARNWQTHVAGHLLRRTKAEGARGKRLATAFSRASSKCKCECKYKNALLEQIFFALVFGEKNLKCEKINLCWSRIKQQLLRGKQTKRRRAKCAQTLLGFASLQGAKLISQRIPSLRCLVAQFWFWERIAD